MVSARRPLVLLVAWPGWLETAELKAYDWRMRNTARLRVARGQPLVHPDIVLVEITDASIRDLSGFVGRWPWPRALQAMLVDYISSGKPRAIALDLTFLEPERPPDFEAKYTFLDRGEISSTQSDQAFADAVRRAGNVITLADAVDAGLDNGELVQQDWPAPPYRLGPAIEERPVITLPYPALTSAAAGLAHNLIALDPDGPARRFPPFVRQGDRYMPLLGVAAALAGGGYRPEEVVLEGQSIRIRDRSIPAGPDRSPSTTIPNDVARPADDADQLPGAGARRRPAAVPLVRRVPAAEITEPARRRREARHPGRRVQGQDRVRRSSPSRAWSTCFRRRSARARCPASSCTRASPTASCRTASSGRRPAGRRAPLSRSARWPSV